MKHKPCPAKISNELRCQKKYGHRGKCFCAESCDNGTVMLLLEWEFTKIKPRATNA